MVSMTAAMEATSKIANYLAPNQTLSAIQADAVFWQVGVVTVNPIAKMVPMKTRIFAVSFCQLSNFFHANYV